MIISFLIKLHFTVQVVISLPKQTLPKHFSFPTHKKNCDSFALNKMVNDSETPKAILWVRGMTKIAKQEGGRDGRCKFYIYIVFHFISEKVVVKNIFICLFENGMIYRYSITDFFCYCYYFIFFLFFTYLFLC